MLTWHRNVDGSANPVAAQGRHHHQYEGGSRHQLPAEVLTGFSVLQSTEIELVAQLGSELDVGYPVAEGYVVLDVAGIQMGSVK